MWLDALLAYLHFTAVFVLFAFLTVEVVLVRTAIDAKAIRDLARTDLWYFGAAIAVLASGALRLLWGAKGPAYYFGDWTFYAKVALFFAVAAMSIAPTLAFSRWRRQLDRDPGWQVPDAERRRIRGYLMIEIHLAAMIPVFAVVTARALAR